MPVPASINDLSTTAGSNSPPGSESPATLDDYLRAHAAFIAQLRDSGNTTSATANAALSKGANRIINGNFQVNQRGVSGTVVLAAGQYGHDRWKAGASGCTYTFATSGGVTTLTITAGSLQQVIEGSNLQTGTHVLSWTGTAQGKIGAGSYAASGVTGSVTGGSNLTIEFNAGTLSLVQLEPGSVASPFEHRAYGKEEHLCRRYFQAYGRFRASQYAAGPSTMQSPFPICPVMRATPTALLGSASVVSNASAIALSVESASSAFWSWNSVGSGQSFWAVDSATLSAEL